MQTQNPIFSFLSSKEFLTGACHARMFAGLSFLRESCNEIGKQFVASWIDVYEAIMIGKQPHQIKEYREVLEKEGTEAIETHKNKVARLEAFMTEKSSSIFVSGFLTGFRLAEENMKNKKNENEVKTQNSLFECNVCGNKDVLPYSTGDGEICCSKCKSKDLRKWESATGEDKS